jgi:hypothetical protein
VGFGIGNQVTLYPQDEGGGGVGDQVAVKVKAGLDGIAGDGETHG